MRFVLIVLVGFIAFLKFEYPSIEQMEFPTFAGPAQAAVTHAASHVTDVEQYTSVAAAPAAPITAPRLVSLSTVIAAIGVAPSVTISAYTLSMRGSMARALIAARRRGAIVHVFLDGQALAEARADNVQTQSQLQQFGIDAQMTTYAIHLKGVNLGSTAFVSDRNWASGGRSIILQLPGEYASTVQYAIQGQMTSHGAFTTRKLDSLLAEAQLLAVHHSTHVFIETESFGSGTSVYDVLLARARMGDAVTLVVAREEYDEANSEREHEAIANLIAAGQPGKVRAYISSATEKIAIDGLVGWTGSSNATLGPEQVDWGYSFSDPQMVSTLLGNLQANAADGQPVTGT